MIIQGNCQGKLLSMKAGSVQTCITSPPYFGLRDYNHDEQIGLEETPDDYIAKMVEVLREVRRVLRDDGTLWLNIGDSYFTGTTCGIGGTNSFQAGNKGSFFAHRTKRPDGIKGKDLIGIPWMLAFALRSDGWYLRNDSIWHKPNCMPFSGNDRCTVNHEYIFLLTKSPCYFYDAEAIKEQGVHPAGTKAAKGSGERQNERLVNGRPPDYKIYDGMRNKRTVWTVTTKPFKGAHFAVFPEDLIEPCVLAGTSEKGCCSECGAPYERILSLKNDMPGLGRGDKDPNGVGSLRDENGTIEWGDEHPGRNPERWYSDQRTEGWAPRCGHVCEALPCTILDPFAGSGTVGVVAAKYGREFIGVELNPEYAEMARKRIKVAESQPVLF